jgi:hypothetical protein
LAFEARLALAGIADFTAQGMGGADIAVAGAADTAMAAPIAAGMRTVVEPAQSAAIAVALLVAAIAAAWWGT